MIDSIGGFLQHNLVVLVAVVVVPLKLLVLRLCGDSEAQGGALLAIPEDICYVALGLILGDVASSGGAFRKYFAGSTHVLTDIIVTIAITIGISILIHLFAKVGNDNFRTWRAAVSAHDGSGDAQRSLNLKFVGSSADENVDMIGVRHLAVWAIMYALQFILVIKWLRWIASVVASA